MSCVVGFKIIARSISWVAVEGTQSCPAYVEHHRDFVPEGREPEDLLAEWVEPVFTNVINRLKPARIAYMLTLPQQGKNPSFDHIRRVYYPLGLLAFMAHKDDIPVACESLKGKPFGLRKLHEVEAHVRSLLGDYSTHWDREMLHAAAAAILRLPQ
jgi:hypothetical protein